MEFKDFLKDYNINNYNDDSYLGDIKYNDPYLYLGDKGYVATRQLDDDELVEQVKDRFDDLDKLKKFVSDSLGIDKERFDAFVKNCEREKKLKRINK